MADHIRAVSSQHKRIEEEKMKILVSAASACGLLVGFILLLLHCQSADAGDLTPESSVIKKALTYIRTCQHEDGGFWSWRYDGMGYRGFGGSRSGSSGVEEKRTITA